MAKAWDQQQERRAGFFRDQHGRKYSAQIDKGTGDPVGFLTMVEPYGAPINPVNDPETWRCVPEEPGIIEVLYDRWEAKCEEATKLFQAEERRIALSLYGDKAMEALESPTPALRRLTGIAPLSPLVIRAMRGGSKETPPSKRNPNKYVLGLRPFDPENPIDVKIRAALHQDVDPVRESEDWESVPEAPVLEPVKKSHHKKPATAEV